LERRERGEKMIEIVGDIFEQRDADAICFTSNSIVKANGELVMGAGIAKAFKDRWPYLAVYFGQLVKTCGNKVHVCDIADGKGYRRIFNFPTKNHFKDKSDLNLIVDSAKQLVEIVNQMEIFSKKKSKIYLTKPGCGLGGLNWETQVKPAIKDILDDRFYVVEKNQ
jgi:hypothetical protein